MCFMNRTTTAKNIEFNWAEENVKDEHFGYQTNFDSKTYNLRNVWTHKDVGSTKKKLQEVLPGHDVLMLRLTPVI